MLMQKRHQASSLRWLHRVLYSDRHPAPTTLMPTLPVTLMAFPIHPSPHLLTVCASMGLASHSGLSGAVSTKWGSSTPAARRAAGHSPRRHAVAMRCAQQLYSGSGRAARTCKAQQTARRPQHITTRCHGRTTQRGQQRPTFRTATALVTACKTLDIRWRPSHQTRAHHTRCQMEHTALTSGLLAPRLPTMVPASSYSARASR